MERMDISKYKNLLDSFFIKNCTVRLVRDDLNKLRDLLTNKLNRLNCNICTKVYTSAKRLQNHKKNKHLLVNHEKKPQKRVSFSDKVIIHDIAEYHSCRKCSKIFESYSMLKIHMRNEHKKRKCYICYYCTKKFVDRMFFKVHIKLHCDVCGQFSMNKRKLIEHRQNICNVFKKHKCKGCEKVFLSYLALKDHMFDHYATDFVCNNCKGQFKSKCALAYHIIFLHSKHHLKNLYIFNSGIYQCKFCDESADGRDVIENHVLQLAESNKTESNTNSQESFSCDQCNAKYQEEFEYFTHQWTHYLNIKKTNQFKYKIGDPLPDRFKPKLVLNRIQIPEKVVDNMEKPLDDTIETADVLNGELENQTSDRKSRTLISKHQCEVSVHELNKTYFALLKAEIASIS